MRPLCHMKVAEAIVEIEIISATMVSASNFSAATT
jgi:hypothetical protein